MKTKKIEKLRNMADTFGRIVVTKETAKKVGVSRKEAYALAQGMGVGVIAAMSVLEGDDSDTYTVSGSLRAIGASEFGLAKSTDKWQTITFEKM